MNVLNYFKARTSHRILNGHISQCVDLEIMFLYEVTRKPPGENCSVEYKMHFPCFPAIQVFISAYINMKICVKECEQVEIPLRSLHPGSA